MGAETREGETEIETGIGTETESVTGIGTEGDSGSWTHHHERRNEIDVSGRRRGQIGRRKDRRNSSR